MAAPALPPLDDADAELRTPIKRLGSTRKLAAFASVRVSLGAAARAVEARGEAAAGAAAELADYCRRRADLETEYARALDKLARRAPALLSGHARGLARDHAALGALYGQRLAPRVARAGEDAARLRRKCRDLLAARTDDVLGALADAAAAGKARSSADARAAADARKLRHAHDQRAAADVAKPKKLRALDKHLEKRRRRYMDSREVSLRARTDYILSLEAADATLQRYYLDDLADVLRCMELGLDAVAGRALSCAVDAETSRAAALAAAARELASRVAAVDPAAERAAVLAALGGPRAAPLPRPDAAAEDVALAEALGPAAPPPPAPLAELTARLHRLEAATDALRADLRAGGAALREAEAELQRQLRGPDADWAADALLAVDPPPPAHDHEDYYLTKFRAYLSAAGRLARLDSKAAALRGGGGGAAEDGRLPHVVEGCVRVLAAHGLRHQGLFRVSGSQAETLALRAALERGEDPLAAAAGPDVNAVAGLLKLQLRELRPPLLPPALLERLSRLVPLPDAQFAAAMRELVSALPLSSVLVLRHVFAFLAHVAAHSHENMMDAWNLAICLGPTLLAARASPAGSQVAAQNLVNELVKRCIIMHERLFPQHVAPHALYRRELYEPPADTPDHSDHPDHPPADEPDEPTDETDAPPRSPSPADDEPDSDDDLDDDDDDDDEEEESAVLEEPPPAASCTDTPDLVQGLPGDAPAAGGPLAVHSPPSRRSPAAQSPPPRRKPQPPPRTPAVRLTPR